MYDLGIGVRATGSAVDVKQGWPTGVLTSHQHASIVTVTVTD